MFKSFECRKVFNRTGVLEEFSATPYEDKVRISLVCGLTSVGRFSVPCTVRADTGLMRYTAYQSQGYSLNALAKARKATMSDLEDVYLMCELKGSLNLEDLSWEENTVVNLYTPLSIKDSPQSGATSYLKTQQVSAYGGTGCLKVPSAYLDALKGYVKTSVAQSGGDRVQFLLMRAQSII